MVEFLTALVRLLLRPAEKPPIVQHYDKRLDAVEERWEELRRKRLQLELDNLRRRQ